MNININDEVDDDILPKKTRNQIQKWLLQWLIPLEENEQYFTLNEVVYRQHFQLRFAFMIYTITQNCETGEWIWHCVENYYVLWNDFLRAPRFSTYEDLIQYATDEFYHKEIR